MGISALEELLDSLDVLWVDISVVDEVFAGIFGIVTSSVLRKSPN